MVNNVFWGNDFNTNSNKYTSIHLVWVGKDGRSRGVKVMYEPQ